MISPALEILDDFIALIYPRYCRGCNDSLVKGETLICTRCMLEMPRSHYHLEKENPFYNKFKGRLPVSYVMTLFKFMKGGRVQQMLHALKYKDQPQLGHMFGMVYGEDLKAAAYQDKFDLIIPVPLHRSRKRTRGYNQSERFGAGLSEALGIPCSDNYMERIISTQTQTKKSKLNRWNNVSVVFKVTKENAVKGKRILLVDDVVTTGATLEACGQVLMDAGCKELSIACIAAAQ